MVRKIFAYGASGAAIALLALAGAWVKVDSALAHSDLERSTPADGEVLAEAPERVDAYFGQEMSRSQGFPKMTVVNEAGDTIADETVLDDADRKHLSVELPPSLPEGRYTVIWHTLSDEDGEEAQGAFHYYVGEGPGATGAPNATPGATDALEPTSAPVDENGDDDGGVPAWALVVGIIGGVVVGGGAGLAFGRRE